MKPRLMDHGLSGLLALFVAAGLAFALVTPLFEISDELWHYPMVKTLADGNGLPVQDPANPQPWRQEGSQPPLYYALMAAATSWIDTSDMAQVRWLNPHVDNGVVTADRNHNLAVHPADEAGRWTGTALAVRLIRGLSVLLGAVTVYCTYRLSLALMPERRGLALAAAALAGFTPMFTFISASVNNDTLAVALASATLWRLVCWLRQPPVGVGREPLVLGVLLGLGALSKQSALGLMGLTGLVILAGVWGLGDWRRRLAVAVTQGTVVFGVAALIGFWWYARNWLLYGDWLGWNTFIAIAGPRPQPATLWQLWGERESFLRAYWGLFGGVNVPLPEAVYAGLNVMAAMAVAGLGWAVLRRRAFAWRAAAPWALLGLWLVLLMIGLVRWSSLTQASQGRLIFPGIAALSVLLAAGLSQWRAWLPGAAALGLAALTLAVPWGVIAPYYRPPVPLTPAEQAAIPAPLDADFGGELRLLGYALHTAEAQPGEALRFTLYWRSEIAMDRNWSVFVHVVDEQGVIVAQRDRYPGQGLLATTLLQPGQTWADDYVIPLPAGTLTPAVAQLAIGVYDQQDGARLPVGPAGADRVLVGPITLAPRADTAVPNALRQSLGGELELSGYTLDRRALRAGETLATTLYWRALRPMAANYSVSVRVRGGDDLTRWAAQDSWPRGGSAPTSAWKLDQVIEDPYTLTLAQDTPPGQYRLEVVVYAPETLAPLALWNAAGYPTDGQAVTLSRLVVVP